MLRSLLTLGFLLFIVSCSTTEQGQTPSVEGPSTPTPSPSCSGAQSKALNAPWKSLSTSIVIDAYQRNSIDWNKMATDPRMVAVIHRSAYGTKVDSKYKERKAIAKSRGYLWGAYHLARPGNIEKQAQMLIDAAGEDLMILDLEDTNNSQFASLDEARVFMKYVYDKTGKLPVVYANHSTAKLINTKFKNDPLFKGAKFWYARFKSNVTDFPSGVWSGYFLWQFSSEINCSKDGTCLYNVAGTRYDMDINVFDGSAEELRSCWNN